MQPNPSNPRPLYPDQNDVDNQNLIKLEEREARRRAWIMAKQIGHIMGEFKDKDDNFFVLKDPTKPNVLYASSRNG